MPRLSEAPVCPECDGCGIAENMPVLFDLGDRIEPGFMPDTCMFCRGTGRAALERRDG